MSKLDLVFYLMCGTILIILSTTISVYLSFLIILEFEKMTNENMEKMKGEMQHEIMEEVRVLINETEEELKGEIDNIRTLRPVVIRENVPSNNTLPKGSSEDGWEKLVEFGNTSESTQPTP